MRIFISTGEVSGDLQGSLLIQSLQQLAVERGVSLELVGLGGNLMAQAGAALLANTAEIGSVGLSESLRFLWPTWQIQQRVKAYLRKQPVDLVILIDYMGPNVAIASYLRQQFPDIPILYYIAPQAWIWSPTAGNIRQLVKITDRLLAIFPEEAEFFRSQGVNVTWVGHPLLDRIAQAPSRAEARQQLGVDPDQLMVTLLPASRVQELTYLLPVICAAAQKLQQALPHIQFYLPISLEAYRQRIEETVKGYGLQVTFLPGLTLAAIAAADLAITKSGTVNLEIALLNVPQVILYRVSPFTMFIARRLFRFDIPFVSPPNIVMKRQIVPELLQEAATPDRIYQESLKFLQQPDIRQTLHQDYQQLRATLGEVGVCDRAAQEIFQFLAEQYPNK